MKWNKDNVEQARFNVKYNSEIDGYFGIKKIKNDYYVTWKELLKNKRSTKYTLKNVLDKLNSNEWQAVSEPKSLNNQLIINIIV